MSLSKPSIYEDYRNWVLNHPHILSQVESIGRITSYLIAGRVNKSPVVSEFLYSATNIIVFINDQILRNAFLRIHAVHNSIEKLRVFITIIEHLEVFLEIGASRLAGSRGKWIVVTVIQIIKFLWRIYMLMQCNQGLSSACPLPPLNRKIFKRYGNTTVVQENGPRDSTFTLQSGRVIRTISGAPQLRQRTWNLPVITEEINQQTKLAGYPLVGEVIYAVKPLTHLMAMYKFGLNSWFPWLLSLTMDVSSLNLLASCRLHGGDRKEFSRRQMSLLMYLLRSPFYDDYSRMVLIFLLIKLQKLPVVGVFSKQLLRYLPHWQQLYFYTWD